MNAGGGDSHRGLVRVQNSAGLVATVRSKLGLGQLRNFLRLKHLPTRAFIENTLGSTPRLRARKRLDVDRLGGEQLIRMSPGYFFASGESGPIMNASKLLLNRKGVICRSDGARHLSLKNSTHTAGWDIIEHSGGATFLQLDSDNEQLIESYALNQKLVGWNSTHIVYRELEPWDCSHPEEGLVLFGSYMEQWGHFVIDLTFRLIDNIEEMKNYNIFIQEGTPENAREIIKLFAPNSKIWEVPVGKSVTLKRAIVPLSRTLNPVGWQSHLTPYETGWGWSIDGPAIGRLPKLPSLQGATDNSKRRIFLDRSKSNVSITNISEVRSLLESQGFEKIDAEELPLRELLEVLGEAEIVVGGSGSQLLNLLFLRKSIKVIKLTHRLDGITGISSALKYAGHDVITIVNDWKMAPAGSPYERKQAPIVADLDLLRQALNDSRDRR